jgi:hypothetical protein
MINTNIHKHDIIKVMEAVYIDYPGGPWWDHFVIKPVFYRVKTEPTNNGNFLGVTSQGIQKHFNTVHNDIIEVIKKGVPGCKTATQ